MINIPNSLGISIKRFKYSDDETMPVAVVPLHGH